jgi:serine/threonine protein kinase
VRITDFGVAKFQQKENSSETSGTPGYMAPEVMVAQNHNYLVDYFAVGVMGFEFMYGKRPYLGKSRKEIKDLILAKQVQIKPNEIYEGWSMESADFINKVQIK